MSLCRLQATRALLPSEASSMCSGSSHRVSPLAVKARVDTPERLYEWLKKCKHCKLVHTELPELGCEIVDVSMLKRKSEDKVYLKNDLLHCVLRRGLSLALITGEGNKKRRLTGEGADDDAAKDEAMKVVLLRQGLPKFFDIDVDDDLTEQQPEKPSWLRKRLAERWPTTLYLLDKANGENAQVSWSVDLSAWVICSKNVSLVAREAADLKRFGEDRFEYAQLVAQAWFEEVEKLQRLGTLETIREVLSHHTLIGELCGRSEVQHLVKYETQGLKWYALVANVCGAESACVDPRDALTILGRCGLTTIGEVGPVKEVRELATNDWGSLRKEIASVNAYEMDDVDSVEKLINCPREGVVAYFERRSSGGVVVVALGKAKTAQYKLLRRLREVMKESTKRRRVGRAFMQMCETMLHGNSRKKELLVLFSDLCRRVQFVVNRNVEGFGAYEVVDKRFPELLLMAARTEVEEEERAEAAAGRVVVIHVPPGVVPKGLITDDVHVDGDGLMKWARCGRHVVQLPNLLRLRTVKPSLRKCVKIVRYGWGGPEGNLLERTLKNWERGHLYDTDKTFFALPRDKQCALLGKWLETLDKVAIPGVQQVRVDTEEELVAVVEEGRLEGAGEAQRVLVVAPVGLPGSGKTRLLEEVFARLPVVHGKYRQNMVEEHCETTAESGICDALYLSSDEFAEGGRADRRRQRAGMRRAAETFMRERVGVAERGSTHVVIIDKNHVYGSDMRGSAQPFMKPDTHVEVVGLFLTATEEEESVWEYPWGPRMMTMCLRRVLGRKVHPTLGSGVTDEGKKAAVFFQFWKLFERYPGLQPNKWVRTVLKLPVVEVGKWRKDGRELAEEIVAALPGRKGRSGLTYEVSEEELEKVHRLVEMVDCDEESFVESDKCVKVVVKKLEELAAQCHWPLYVGVDVSGDNREILVKHVMGLLGMGKWKMKDEFHVTLSFFGCREPEGEKMKEIVQGIATGEHIMVTVTPRRLLVVPERLVCVEVEVSGPPAFLDDLQPQEYLHITMALDAGCPARLAREYVRGFHEQWDVIEGTPLSNIQTYEFNDKFQLPKCTIRNYFK